MTVYDEQMEVLADKIMAGVVQDKEERLAVMSTFSRELFRNENYVLYTVLQNFREQNLVPDADFLDIYLHRNQDIVLKDNGRFIDRSLFDTENDLIDEVIASTIKSLNSYKDIKVDDDYKNTLQLDKQKFKQMYKTNAFSEINENMTLIMKDSIKIGRKVYSGVDDAQQYYEEQSAEVNALVSEESKDLYYLQEVKLQDKQDSPRLIGDFGDLTFLNEQFDGMYSGMFYSVMAPTKGGKSKFCYRQIHNVAIRSGNPVLMWPAEGGKEKAKAELRAIHFVYYWEHIMGKNLTEDGYVEASDILKGRYPSQEIQDMEKESNLDLNNNPEYGDIAFIEERLKSDRYMSIIRKSIDKVQPALLVVDYLQLMLPPDSGPLAKQSKNERIGQAYAELLSLTKEKNIAFLTPAQMKQDAIQDLAAGKDVDTRVLGGESSEIVRTPDYNIALYGTPEDIQNNSMTLLSIPSREAKPFGKHPIGAQLGYSYYFDLDE